MITIATMERITEALQAYGALSEIELQEQLLLRGEYLPIHAVRHRALVLVRQGILQKCTIKNLRCDYFKLTEGRDYDRN